MSFFVAICSLELGLHGVGSLKEKRGIVKRVVNRTRDRFRIAVSEVGALKNRGDSPVYVAGRERDLVARLVELNPGPFPNAGLPHVFREVISATRSLEEIVRVAFLGPLGTFSHEAAVKQFGGMVEFGISD